MAWLRRRDQKGEARARAWRRALRAAVAEDWAAAETWIERIVEADSAELDAYHALAHLYRRQGAVGRAIRMHQNLLLRSDLDRAGRADALLELARDFDVGGFTQRAIASYEEYLDAYPRHGETLLRLVTLLHLEREFPRALALVRRLRRHDRAVADRLEVQLLLDQARSRHAEGDSDGARKTLKRCLRRDRSSGAAWAMLGELEAERGRDARALDAWKRGVAAEPALASDLFPKIAASFAARGQAAEFERYLRDVVEQRPGDVIPRIALARALASRGDAAEAVEVLSRAVELMPERLDLRAALGRSLLDADLETEALKAYADLLDQLERSGASEGRGTCS